MARAGVSVWSYMIVTEEPCLVKGILVGELLQVSVVVHGRGRATESNIFPWRTVSGQRHTRCAKANGVKSVR